MAEREFCAMMDDYYISKSFAFIKPFFMFWLQLRLLSNGFRLLKVGGSLVYSTCRCIFLPFIIAVKIIGFYHSIFLLLVDLFILFTFLFSVK